MDAISVILWSLWQAVCLSYQLYLSVALFKKKITNGHFLRKSRGVNNKHKILAIDGHFYRCLTKDSPNGLISE